MTTSGMRWASALSLDIHLEDALAEAIGTIQTALGQRPSVVFLFVSPQHRAHYEQVLAAVHKNLAPDRVLGCSGSGVIGAGHEAENVPALSLTAAVLPGVSLTPVRLEDAGLPNPDGSPRLWEDAAGIKASAAPNFILLADAFSIRADEMLSGFDFAFPKAVKIGGIASGSQGPGQSALFLDHRLHREGAVGLALTGALRIDTLLSQGCRPIGRPMSVTRCHRNILVELDHEPALEVLSGLFSKAKDRDRHLIRTSLYMGLARNPLQAGEPQAGDFLVRRLVGMDAERGALAVGALLREGQTVQFHICDAVTAGEDVASVLRDYSEEVLLDDDSGAAAPRGALLFSCLSRGMRLFGRPDHDSRAFFSHIGQVPLGGFFCNGEISQAGGATHIHGFTSCFGLFRPK